MSVILRLSNIVLRDQSRDWKKEPALLEEVLNCLRASGLWWEFEYFSTNSGGTYKRFSKPEQFVRAMAAQKHDPMSTLAPHPPKEEDELPYRFDILPNGTAISLRFIVEDGSLEQEPRLLDQFVDFVSQLHARLHPTALMGPELALGLLDLDMPHLRPERRHPFLGSPLFFVSQEFQRSHPQGNPEDLKKLLQAPMPPNATRELRGDLVIFRWLQDLSDPKRVREAVVAQQKWLVDVLNPPVHDSYNEWGDYQYLVTSQSPSEYLTFQDMFTNEGFKAMVVHPDGSVDEDTLDELAEWNKAGTLPDGTPLPAVSILLPNRESALRIHPLAQARGITRVLFLDDQNRMWDPFPPGIWIDYPVRKSAGGPP